MLAAHHSRHGRVLQEKWDPPKRGGKRTWTDAGVPIGPLCFGVTFNHIHARPVFPGGTVCPALIGVDRPAVALSPTGLARLASPDQWAPGSI